MYDQLNYFSDYFVGSNFHIMKNVLINTVYTYETLQIKQYINARFINSICKLKALP